MRINGFRCDACGKEHLLDPTLTVQSYWSVLPIEWFMVSTGPRKKDAPWDNKEPYTFCSANCLKDWSTKQTIIEYEKVN